MEIFALPTKRRMLGVAFGFAIVCAPAALLAQGPTASSTRQLILLAGQSNMAGRGVVEPQDVEVRPRVEMLDRNLRWVPAADPVHYDKPSAGVGPGRAFALALAARDSTQRVGLVPTAVGGSPISTWEPGAVDVATNTHPYDDAMVRARAAMQSGSFKAILWHQGESDATPELSLLYEKRLRALIARFRADLGNANLPFLIGQLGQFDAAPWNSAKSRVDSIHRVVAATTPNVAYVAATGLRDKGDALHFDAASARELGKRYAEAFFALQSPSARPKQLLNRQSLLHR